jgi:Ulp1 family protease
MLKNQVSNFGSVLVLVLHQNNHWFYLTVSPPQPNYYSNSPPKITVYDSTRKYNPNEYREMKTIYNIINFSLRYYNVLDISFEVCPTFPQQCNNSDCGVMTLCGIKDTVRE